MNKKPTTFNQFLLVVQSLDIIWAGVDKYIYNHPQGLKYYDIYLDWTTGGIAGGSCWDTGDSDPHYSFAGDREPEFQELDRILTKVAPKISFLEYKTILNDVINYSDYGVNEYYGNSTNYGRKSVNLAKLYNKLVADGFLKGEPTNDWNKSLEIEKFHY